MNSLPYGIEHIEQFVELRYEKGTSAYGIALGEAMDKDSGKWRRDRVKAYEEHFDTVIDETIVKPVKNMLMAHRINMSEYTIKVEQDCFTFNVIIYNILGDKYPTLGFSMSKKTLGDEHMFKSVAHEIYNILFDRSTEKMNADLWHSLSSYEKTALHKAFNGEVFMPDVDNPIPMRVYNLLENKGLIEDLLHMTLSKIATDVIIYALQNKFIE